MGERLLVHDNGWTRPGPRASRVAEYVLDFDARTARLVWWWTEPDWYEPIWGDADWLPSGHVLVTRAHCGHCATGGGTTELIEIDPATDTVTWRLSLLDPAFTGYRAQRLEPCTIFDHRGYCP